MSIHSRAFAVIAATLFLPAVLHAAEEPAKPEAGAERATTVESGEKGARKVASKAKCEYLTGSRIRHDPPVDCDSGAQSVRSFSREELERTGETNLADALRNLDPRIR